MRSSAAVRWTAAVIIFVIFLMMLLFNFLTPMVSDDFAHYYGMEDEHVTTITGIVHNMVIFREKVNGRVVPHFLVYLFLLLPRTVFRFLNAAVSAFIPLLLSRYYRRDWELKILFLLLCSAFSIWFFTPSFGEIYLWLTGSINYSWGLALDLLLIYPFFCAYTGKPCRALAPGTSPQKILLPFLALIVGAYSENGGAAVLCVISLLGLLTWIRIKRFPLYLFTVFLCTCTGFLFLMTAPATLSTRAGGDIREHIWYCRLLTRKYMTALLIVYTFLLILAFLRKIERQILVFSFILVFAAGVSIVVFIFAAYLPDRSFMIAVTFTILAILCLLSELLNLSANRFLYLLPAASLILFLWSFPSGAKDISLLHRQQVERELFFADAIAENRMDVSLPAFKTFTDYSACPREELSEDSTDWYNDLIARYYHVSSVTAMPEGRAEE